MPILIEELTVEVLENLIESAVKKALEENSSHLPNFQPEKLLTRKEACKLLKISSPTLTFYTNEGHIPYHKIGSRVRYKKSELLNLNSVVYGSKSKKR
tara:strand:+ start:47 stop:340 length:294 start_codon:yes stop_codon:yes gene_type:complete